jgi:hypothetical protein
MPGPEQPRTCSIAAAAISFAIRMRSISCSVLSGAASASSGVASCRLRERVEPGLRIRRRLADHAVGGLRAERELEADRS